eukprot:7377932-Prymnesium_polylepis.1
MVAPAPDEEETAEEELYLNGGTEVHTEEQAPEEQAVHTEEEMAKMDLQLISEHAAHKREVRAAARRPPPQQNVDPNPPPSAVPATRLLPRRDSHLALREGLRAPQVAHLQGRVPRGHRWQEDLGEVPPGVQEELPGVHVVEVRHGV